MNPEEVGHGHVHVTSYAIVTLYGFSVAACTKVVWSSFGQVLLSILYKKRILFEFA